MPATTYRVVCDEFKGGKQHGSLEAALTHRDRLEAAGHCALRHRIEAREPGRTWETVE